MPHYEQFPIIRRPYDQDRLQLITCIVDTMYPETGEVARTEHAGVEVNYRSRDLVGQPVNAGYTPTPVDRKAHYQNIRKGTRRRGDPFRLVRGDDPP
jgi:hypothetical protein